MKQSLYKEWITGVFDRSAPIYGQSHGDFFNYFAKRLVEMANLPKSARVLDVATGRGAILKRAAEIVGSNGSVVGVDISPVMIEQTAKETSHSPNIQLFCGDAEHLDFEDNSFDYVFCGFGVFFFPNVNEALKEIYRVLKPNGHLLVSTWGKDDECDAIFHETYNSITTQERIVLHQFDNPEFIQEILSRSGFIEIKIVPECLEYIYPTIEAWFSSLWSHAMRAKLERLSPQQLIELKSSLEKKMQRLLQADGLHEALHVHYTHAVKHS